MEISFYSCLITRQFYLYPKEGQIEVILLVQFRNILHRHMGIVVHRAAVDVLNFETSSGADN